MVNGSMISVNYNDLTATSVESGWISGKSSPSMALMPVSELLLFTQNPMVDGFLWLMVNDDFNDVQFMIWLIINADNSWWVKVSDGQWWLILNDGEWWMMLEGEFAYDQMKTEKMAMILETYEDWWNHIIISHEISTNIFVQHDVNLDRL